MFDALADRTWIDCEQLLALTGKKQKRQRECKTFGERQRNIAGAYEAVEEKEIVGANIVLLDDVLTTGSTLDACVSVLKDAGANAVVSVVLARTVKRKETDHRQRELSLVVAGGDYCCRMDSRSLYCGA